MATGESPMEKRLLELERALKGMSSDEIERWSTQEGIQDQELVRLLDARSRPVGDEVALLLVKKTRPELVASALLGRQLHRALGRVRATWVLHQFGKKFEQASKAYLALLDDP